MKEKPSRNIVIIGSKPVMNYVVACLTLFNDGAGSVRVRARGRHIVKAVDSIELLRRIFLKDTIIDKIKIGTDKLTRDDGNQANVSTLEIRVIKAPSSVF
jgi:DNA-binding protein